MTESKHNIKEAKFIEKEVDKLECSNELKEEIKQLLIKDYSTHLNKKV